MDGTGPSQSQEPSTISRNQMRVAESQGLESSPTAFLNMLALGWIGSWKAGTETGPLCGSVHIQKFILLCHNASPSHILLKFVHSFIQNTEKGANKRGKMEKGELLPSSVSPLKMPAIATANQAETRSQELYLDPKCTIKKLGQLWSEDSIICALPPENIPLLNC